jgi:hypothetical protein
MKSSGTTVGIQFKLFEEFVLAIDTNGSHFLVTVHLDLTRG